MSDSVDRVFVHALATVRRLPRTGSSRPPPAARLRLYGLYKQSMEGDVSAILPRPSLPPNSPNPNDPPSNNPNAVHRYASRDLRARELQAEIEKWDAWNECKGMSRTEAKRRYITTLIETMKEYASGTTESRELVSELEFVWNQIRSQSGSDESEEGESPTRKLERAGLKGIGVRMGSERSSGSPGQRPVERESGGIGRDSLFSRISGSGNGDNENGRPNNSRTESKSQSQPQSNSQSRSRNSGLRILSPISQRSRDDIIESEELPQPIPEHHPDGEHMEEEDEHADRYRTTPSSPTHDHNPARDLEIPIASSSPGARSTDPWRASIEATLRTLTLELTALREQLSSHNLLSRSYFSHAYTYPLNYSDLPLITRIRIRCSNWLRWSILTVLKQMLIQLGLLIVILIYGRLKGDTRVETWLRNRLKTGVTQLRDTFVEGSWRVLPLGETRSHSRRPRTQ